MTDKNTTKIPDIYIPKKVFKKQKGYYLSETIIEFIKDEAERQSDDGHIVSENDTITAIINFYIKHRSKK